ncbi:MAG TPA: acetolactate synthase small subunit [bacterium]|nr:acetolactate synthase small subunit [bacterium]
MEEKISLKHTFSVLVANKPGVLTRVAGLFSRRGYNIDSLAVGTTIDPAVSRITLVVEGNERILEQVSKQLNKLIEVKKVIDITDVDTVDRGLFLIKVNAEAKQRQEIISIANIFRAQVVDVGEKSMILEVTGNEEKVDAIQRLLNRYGIIEMVRTGKVVLLRGEKKT